MAKALLGTYTTPRAAQLLDEVRRLRARVAELEDELEQAREAAHERLPDHEAEREEDPGVVTLDEPAVAAS